MGKVERELTESQGQVAAPIQLFLPGKRAFLCLTLWPQVSRMLLALWISPELVYLPGF